LPNKNVEYDIEEGDEDDKMYDEMDDLNKKETDQHDPDFFNGGDKE
jgi:hypothetical protein